MMPDDDACFGESVYAALRSRGRRDALTARMDYAGIQALRAASRTHALELFAGSGKTILKAIELDTPEEFASYLRGFSDGYDRGVAVMYRGAYVYGHIY